MMPWLRWAWRFPLFPWNLYREEQIALFMLAVLLVQIAIRIGWL